MTSQSQVSISPPSISTIKYDRKCSALCSAKRLIWPSFLIILMVVLGILAINSKLVGSEQKRRLKAFEPGKQFLSKAGELYLEDYFYLTSVPSQLDLKRLEMSTTISNKSMDEEKTLNFYKTSVRHLKKAAPNLKEIDLIGGYLWNPMIEEEGKIGASLLKNELEMMTKTLFIVKESLTEANISIQMFSFDAVFVTDRDDADSANYQQLLWDIFQYRVDRISAYYMKFSIPIRKDKTEILLNLSFEPKFKSKPVGRTRFLASLQTNGPEFRNFESKPFI